jgi:hypothetical protein
MDAVDRAGILAFRSLKSPQPARQLILAFGGVLSSGNARLLLAVWRVLCWKEFFPCDGA